MNTLTAAQRAIVAWGDGPAVVIAGAGTGKTRVIIERVAHLLEAAAKAPSAGSADAPSVASPSAGDRAPEPDRDHPFDGPLRPDQVLVLTYNVKAARELEERIDARVGLAARSRMMVSNFHSFCQGILTESAGEAGIPSRPDVLDGVGQVLLLRDLEPTLGLDYHGPWQFGSIVTFINRAKDELVTPVEFDAYVAAERCAFEDRFGPYEETERRLLAQGNLKPLRAARAAYARLRREERAIDTAGGTAAGRVAAAGAPTAAAAEPTAAEPTTAGAEPIAAAESEGAGRYARLGHIDGAGGGWDDDGEAAAAATDTDTNAPTAGDVRLPSAPRYAPDTHAEAQSDSATEEVHQADGDRWPGAARPAGAARPVGAAHPAGAAASAARELEKAADREARRTIAGTGRAEYPGWFAPADLPRIDALRATYVVDGAALEVLRLTELALIYHAYQAELVRRGALDFGEQIAAVTQLFRTRSNILRRWQRRFRYILVDEFQDANIAQIELIELLGRTPDRPDNVMVVGDDDQSIYRFRGASFAAFAEFDRRFGRAPTHDPDAPPPGPPSRLRLEQNFRSTGRVLRAADRLIAGNVLRYEPDKRLGPTREAGDPVALVTCAGPEDEAVAIVDAMREMRAEGAAWSDIAVLYRKHRHREAIVARLREEEIPYTVVGGLSLFATPEIRDLEQSLRAIADPHDDVALARMMTAGPWRLDALEMLAVTRAAGFDGRHILDVIAQGVETGAVGEGREIAPVTRAKLRRLRDTLDELTPLTWREGPFTILERFVERTGTILDLIAADTLEAKRTVVNIASFLRFAADWQRANPHGTLAGFVAYLDAYQTADGELPTSVELTEDVEGVRLMTLYQAKGLEFRNVFVPCLLDGEWPTREGWAGLFPAELLREPVPEGEIHTEEERRLLYVAMTRARDRLVLSTHAGPSVKAGPSAFLGELRDGASDELREIDRVGGTLERLAEGDVGADETTGIADAAALVRWVMPLPTKRERRLELRLRATELIGLLEGTDGRADPEAAEARAQLAADLGAVAEAATLAADEARARGLDPLTFRELALDSGAGANLLAVASPPGRFSYTALDRYERCPLLFAFGSIYRIPTVRAGPAQSFGSTAHAAFEAFTKQRREHQANGEPPPTVDDLRRHFEAAWTPTAFGDRATEARFRRRVDSLLATFYAGELDSLAEAIGEEVPFTLTLEPDDGSDPVRVGGVIDRIDRLPSGGIEVVDYKTGSPRSQRDAEANLQLSIYALACRDELGLGTPERVTLYFTELGTRLSSSRTDEQLDAVRADILARVARIRSGDFAATPGRACTWCDYARICPERAA